MSSDLFVFENSFFSDPFSPFADPHPHLPLEFLEEIQENSAGFSQENSNKNPLDETSSLDQIASALLSSSPPAFSSRTCRCPSSDTQTTPSKQRNVSSTSIISPCLGFSFRPQFDSVLESQMRRVCSTGDLQNVETNMQARNVLSSSPLSTEKSFMEEANFKVGRYSAEERKERIDRYRAKRTQRNFNKTIKYACRKTLADNRPRIRGRFARNDEAGEIPKASMFHKKMKIDLWMDGFHEEDDDGVARHGAFFNGSASTTQYHNYSY
ncbi:UNVERIFIED_CONTAM: Zinc finger protein CONSTANS-LIKE 4 [Sesamum calycinum]|uniref:Zinc finger protein CONSTANS-LIKE 4 n=1 Tax=Sesamum calycinum TaxID=2727403 RepID=A0AAW2M0T6_9LAMI